MALLHKGSISHRRLPLHGMVHELQLLLQFSPGSLRGLSCRPHWYDHYRLRVDNRIQYSISPGLNIQHDANHGAISKNPWVNRILGLTENMIGGSQVNWIHQHVVQHHIHTNDVHLDPDMQVMNNDVRYLNTRKSYSGNLLT